MLWWKRRSGWNTTTGCSRVNLSVQPTPFWSGGLFGLTILPRRFCKSIKYTLSLTDCVASSLKCTFTRFIHCLRRLREGFLAPTFILTQLRIDMISGNQNRRVIRQSRACLTVFPTTVSQVSYYNYSSDLSKYQVLMHVQRMAL